MYGITVRTTELGYGMTWIVEEGDVFSTISLLETAPNVTGYSINRPDGEFLDVRNELGLNTDALTKYGKGR